MCADGSTASQFVSISAAYSYKPMFAENKAFLPSSFTQSIVI